MIRVSEYYDTVKEIPKAPRARTSEYRELYNALLKTPIGTKGKLKTPRNKASAVFSALINLDVDRMIQLSVRNAVRKKIEGKKTTKLVEADIFFERVKKGEARPKREK